MNKPYAEETSMLSIGPLLILLVAAVALVLAAVAALNHLWGIEPASNQDNKISTVEKGPALETAPQPALLEYLAQKQRLLDSYGWLDSTQELAHIPIEAAMQALAAQSALPPARRPAYLMGMDVAQPGGEATQPRAGKVEDTNSAEKGEAR